MDLHNSDWLHHSPVCCQGRDSNPHHVPAGPAPPVVLSGQARDVVFGEAIPGPNGPSGGFGGDAPDLKNPLDYTLIMIKLPTLSPAIIRGHLVLLTNYAILSLAD